MKPVIGLTDTDQIRSVLGLSANDLPDDMLLSRRLDVELRLDLLSWLPDFQTRYESAQLAAATDIEKSIGDALELYSAYYSASILAKSGPLFAAQQIGDGKNMLARFTPISWEKIQADMAAMAAKYKGIIGDLVLTTATEPTAGFGLFAAVGLAVDPVTDTGQGV